MADWISVDESLPDFLGEDKDTSVYVWVTDGFLIEIAQYIYRPRSYGCAIDDDEQKATCGPQPHWHPDVEIGSFRDGDHCFGHIEIFEITHWAYLPLPTKNK